MYQGIAGHPHITIVQSVMYNDKIWWMVIFREGDFCKTICVIRAFGCEM